MNGMEGEQRQKPKIIKYSFRNGDLQGEKEERRVLIKGRRKQYEPSARKGE
jgi:hypothetical protein